LDGVSRAEHFAGWHRSFSGAVKIFSGKDDSAPLEKLARTPKHKFNVDREIKVMKVINNGYILVQIRNTFVSK